MNDIRLSIGLPKKQQPPPAKKRFTAAALIHQKQQLELQQQQQQQQQEEEENHETHHIFRIESPKGKRMKGGGGGGVWWCNAMSCCCYEHNSRVFVILFICTFAWLLTLTMLHIFSGTIPSSSSSSNSIVPIIEKNSRDTLKFEIPFTLQADANSNGRIMTLPVTNLTFERLIRYDVCCTHQAYFVCRSVLKNVGVDAYLTSEKNVVIIIIHPDMVGARCVVMWTERIN